MAKIKSKLKLSSLIITIAGGVLTIPGIALFVAGGVGTKSLSSIDGEQQSKFKSSGFFNQNHNWSVVTSLTSESYFSESIAKRNNVKYDLLGYITYYLSKNNNSPQENPNPDSPNIPTFVSEKDYREFLQSIKTDNWLFISGAVLFPIGIALMIIACSLFTAFKIKNRNKNID